MNAYARQDLFTVYLIFYWIKPIFDEHHYKANLLLAGAGYKV